MRRFLDYWSSRYHLKNYKIKHKLLLTYPPLIIASTLVVSFFCIRISMDLLKEKAIGYSQSIMQQISRSVDIQLQRVDQDSLHFFQNVDMHTFFTKETNTADSSFYPMRTTIEEYLTNFLISHPNIESIYLVNAKQQVISTNEGGITSQDIQAFEKEAMSGDGKIVWLKSRTSMQGNRVIPVVREINDLTTLKQIGTLFMYFLESDINSLLRGQDLKINGELSVLTSDGDVLASDRSDQIGKRYSSGILNRLTGRTGSFFDSAEGNFYFYFKSDYTNWSYLYHVPRNELFDGINAVQNGVLVVAFLFNLIAIFSALVIAGNISKPIIRIVKEMRNIELNKFTVNLQYDGNDELTILSGSFNRMMDELREMMKREIDLQRMQHELEMRAMQAEINPHFLYNTLEAINWKARMNQVYEICEMTSMLADIMRYSIDNRRMLVTISDEMIHVHKYLGIQQIRFKDKLSVFSDIPNTILEAKIPKLTLQPIVENAIIHGLREKIDVGKVRITGQLNDQTIVIKIEDNGCGIDPDKIESLLRQNQPDSPAKKSIGLSNVNMRLKLLFGEAYGLEIYSVAGKGTRIVLSIPYTKGI